MTREERICKEHGYLEPETLQMLHGTYYRQCPECAMRDEAERQAKEEERERRQKAEQIARDLRELEIGGRYVGMTFDDYLPQTQDAERVKLFVSRYSMTFADRLREGDSMILAGKCGTGKNMLAAILCQEVVKQGFTAVHTSVIKMIRAIKESWSRDNDETESRVIRRFSSPDLLVIDEVGVQFGSDTERIYLTEIINNRYESRRPTVIISNLSITDLQNEIGERAVDRFYEGKGGVLAFTWDSYRRKRP